MTESSLPKGVCTTIKHLFPDNTVFSSTNGEWFYNINEKLGVRFPEGPKRKMQQNLKLRRKIILRMSQVRYLKLFFRTGFIIISIYNYISYLNFKNCIDKQFPIKYEFIEAYVNSSRGRSYHMKIVYNEKPYSVDITKKNYLECDSNVQLSLYYSKERDKVISKWGVEKALRISLVFLGLFIASFIPMGKVIGKVMVVPPKRLEHPALCLSPKYIDNLVSSIFKIQ